MCRHRDAAGHCFRGKGGREGGREEREGWRERGMEGERERDGGRREWEGGKEGGKEEDDIKSE